MKKKQPQGPTHNPKDTQEKNAPARDQTSVFAAQPESRKTLISDNTLKSIFLFSIVGMLLTVWISGFNIGFHCDEMDMNNYGKANYAYYMTGGKDKSFMGTKKEGAEVDSLLKFYGSAFEIIAVGTNKITGMDKGMHEFDSRHFINQIFGILAILFAGLTAKKIAGWRAAIFTSWLLFLTPSFFGHILFNTKDIPFCAGYIAAIYFMIEFLEQLPNPTWKTTLGLTVSFAFATNTRIVGVLLIAYLGLFTVLYLLVNKELLSNTLKNSKNVLIKYVTIGGGGFLLVVLTWPYLLMNPVKNFFNALGISSKFPMKVNINFEGNAINSLHVPIGYIPKFMLVTIPIFILLSLLVGAALFLKRMREYDWKVGLLLLVATFFPVIYAIASHAALYSGWRHFLFIYPGICLIAGIGLSEISKFLKKPAFQIAFVALCIVGMFKPIVWCIKNHPYEYTYFNEFVGSFNKAFYAYDNDYWEITMRKAVDKMMVNEPIEQSKDTVSIATNASAFVKYYINRHYPKAKIKVVQSGYTMRNSNYWTYGVFNSLFVKPDYLENYFPPPYVYSENIDDVPVTVILKDTARLDWKAALALKVAQHKAADSLYTAYIKTTKDDNVGLYAYMAVAKGSLNQNDEAIKLANKCLEYHLSPLLDYNSYCALGIAYANKAQWKVSIEQLNKAMSVMPKESAAKDIMRQVLAAQRQSPPKPQ
ncbi:hypothetical protein CJD36_001280 [Flavipsychrobacter stenotrophus]|uniref:Glycosyltransferase RgtA/B/C/D-like domain-containing protein n=1 Tax=Flavipsychrobacter stenotrophus TaxID=2077091 RepID=A0A2S7SZQ5_9BACT|nr:glycosyltransferase family 39 protein [Flavipsychrobacter stenotrophus]PQJ12412.1 hypothetical protein CJD36_001280 [Flavipsychrobacter stenotrophus]